MRSTIRLDVFKLHNAESGFVSFPALKKLVTRFALSIAYALTWANLLRSAVVVEGVVVDVGVGVGVGIGVVVVVVVVVLETVVGLVVIVVVLVVEVEAVVDVVVVLGEELDVLVVVVAVLDESCINQKW